MLEKAADPTAPSGATDPHNQVLATAGHSISWIEREEATVWPLVFVCPT
jgi:hypothetical protein